MTAAARIVGVARKADLGDASRQLTLPPRVPEKTGGLLAAPACS